MFLILLLNDKPLVGDYVDTHWRTHRQLEHRGLRHRHVNRLRRFRAVSEWFERAIRRTCMNNPKTTSPPSRQAFEAFQFLYFSRLLKRRICLDKTNRKNGRLTDLVFRLSEPYPEAVGFCIRTRQRHPTELIPWEKVARIEDEAIFITPSETGHPYPPFLDQKGWILLNEHLMGQTILDTDERRTEVVNDVHLLFSKGRMILVHVDISFNGFLRKWGLERFATAEGSSGLPGAMSSRSRWKTTPRTS